MNSVDKLFKLADRFARKISLGQHEQQQAMEAPDFFFGKGYNLNTFLESLGKLSVQGDKAVGDKSLAALMAAYFNKTGDSVSVNVSVEVKPGVSARWVTQISPPGFTQQAMGELNKQFQTVTGKSWVQGQADANTQAKAAKSVEGPGTKLIVDKGL
jgi:hypothetical protein